MEHNIDKDRELADASRVCNGLYIGDIGEAIDIGEAVDYREILALHGLQPRCGECRPHVEALVSEH